MTGVLWKTIFAINMTRAFSSSRDGYEYLLNDDILEWWKHCSDQLWLIVYYFSPDVSIIKALNSFVPVKLLACLYVSRFISIRFFRRIIQVRPIRLQVCNHLWSTLAWIATHWMVCFYGLGMLCSCLFHVTAIVFCYSFHWGMRHRPLSSVLYMICGYSIEGEWELLHYD